MSMKCYYAFKCNVNGIETLYGLRKQMYVAIQDKYAALFQKCQTKLISEILDDCIYTERNLGKYSTYATSTLQLFLRHYLRQQIQKNSTGSLGENEPMNPEYNFNCQVVFFLFENAIYGMFFSASYVKELYDTLLAIPCVQEYSYWNNTDKPDNVTEAEWGHRRHVWTSIFEKNETPNELGLSLQMTPCYNIGIRAVSVNTEENLKERAKTMAVNSFVNELVNWEEATQTLTVREYSKKHRETINFIYSDKNKAALKERIKFMETQLIPITPATLQLTLTQLLELRLAKK